MSGAAHDESRLVRREDFRFQTPPGGGGPPLLAPAAPAPIIGPQPALSVDRIDIVASPAGAIAGYGPVTTGDLNAPGPWNSAATNGVSNVHQIHFHLDNGNSASLVPVRIVRGSNWVGGVEHKHPPDQVMPPGEAGPPAPGGIGGVIDVDDAPGHWEIKRPAADRIVVADAPGVAALPANAFPYVHQSRFTLTVNSGAGVPIARIRYAVHISKTTAANVPNVINSIASLEKTDIVRGRGL
jgi:hypothetical protein